MVGSSVYPLVVWWSLSPPLDLVGRPKVGVLVVVKVGLLSPVPLGQAPRACFLLDLKMLGTAKLELSFRVRLVLRRFLVDQGITVLAVGPFLLVLLNSPATV